VQQTQPLGTDCHLQLCTTTTCREFSLLLTQRKYIIGHAIHAASAPAILVGDVNADRLISCRLFCQFANGLVNPQPTVRFAWQRLFYMLLRQLVTPPAKTDEAL